ncbi:proline rich membrane protein [Mycobacterium tuberculosis]|nr:proline rich membrane protein [Mycobacterium tuberculosis]
MPGPSSASPLPTTRTHTPSAAPSTAPGETTESPEPGAMQPVVYNVSGEGRAISITYMDTGGMIQTEFNVSLPWSKEVSLSKSAAHPANVTIVNIGHTITCSVTVAGVQVRQRTGAGITICDAPLS